MKKTISFSLVIVIILNITFSYLPLNVSAKLGLSDGNQVVKTSEIQPFTINDRYTVDNFEYKEIGYGKVQLTGVVDPSSLPNDVVIPDTITAGIPTMNFSVVEIGPQAFDYTTIQTIVLPDSIKVIGDSAFENCSNLTDVQLPANLITIGDRAFAQCFNLVNCQLPEGVISLGNNAFSGCFSLPSLVLPNSVTTLGDRVFANCSSATSAVVSENLKVISNGTFRGCTSLTSVSIPEGITMIYYEAFSICSSLTTITLPSTVNSIGADVFVASDALNRIEVSSQEIANLVQESGFTTLSKIFIMPDNINSLPITPPPAPVSFSDGDYNFVITGTNTVSVTEYIGSGTSVAVPSTVLYMGTNYTVTSIGPYAFYFNQNIIDVTLPDTIIYIDEGAFLSCSNMTTINLPNSLTEIRERVFTNCGKLNNVIIPNSVTSIGEASFANCSSLTDITLSNSMSIISGGLFELCNSLTTIILPDSIKTIEESAFARCESLSDIILSENLETIGYRAFSMCDSLTNIEIPENVTSIGREAFEPTTIIHCQDPRTQIEIVKTHDFASYPTSNWKGNATVPGGAIATIEQDTVVNNSVIIETGANITQPVGETLTINGNLQVDGTLTSDENITVYGTLSINGTLDGSSTILIMPGGEISGNYDPNRVLFSITVNNGTSDKSTAKIGETINLNAIIKPGEIFRYWSVDNGVINLVDSNSQSTSFIMPASTVEVSAKLDLRFTVTVTSTQGGVATSSELQPAAGDLVNLSATSDLGYYFERWEVLAGDVVINSSISPNANFIMPYQAVSINAVFAKNPVGAFAINMTNDGNGISMADKNSATAGETIGIAAIPNTGYEFKNWEVVKGNAVINDTLNANSNFTMPSENVEIKAVFVKKPLANYIVTIMSNGNGTVLADKTSATTGEIVNISATPNVGYEFKNWEVIQGNILISDYLSANSNFTMTPENVVIKAIFAKLDEQVITIGDNDRTKYNSGSNKKDEVKIPTQEGIHWLTELEIDKAMTDAKIKKLSYALTQRSDVTGIKIAQLKQLGEFAFIHDTNDAQVQVRVYIPYPKQVNQDLLLSGTLKGSKVNNIKGIFEKWFSNKLRILSLDQKNSWGQKVEVAAKVNLVGIDTKNLYFYSYNQSTNTYKLINNPNYRIDRNNYIRFSTEYAGTIIVSEGPLNKKA